MSEASFAATHVTLVAHSGAGQLWAQPLGGRGVAGAIRLLCLLAVMGFTAACGQSSHSSGDDGDANGGSSAGSNTTTTNSTANATTTSAATTSVATSTTASTAATSAGASGSVGSGTSGSGAGGTSSSSATGSAAAGGSAGAGNELVSDPECTVVNSALLDDCSGDTFCVEVGQNGDGAVYQCTPPCDSDEDCGEGEECYLSDVAFGTRICGPARPVCDPIAGDASCNCAITSSAVLVSGTGDDCEVVSADASACYWQTGTCLDACIPAYFRYDVGDGTALIVRAYEGEMPPGWVSDGQGPAPESCPVVEAEELE